MEQMGQDLETLRRVPFAKAHVEAICEIGHERTYTAGEIVAEISDPMDSFVYVFDGGIEVVNPYTNQRLLDSTLGPTQFMGEIAFLNRGTNYMPMRAAVDTRVIEAPRQQMLDLMARVPELSDHLITVFAARRRKQFELSNGSVKCVGADRDPAVQAVERFLSRNRIPFRSFDLDARDAETLKVRDMTGHKPGVYLATGEQIEAPTPRKVAQYLNLDLDICQQREYDLLIVGGGPAGVAAAVYAGAEGLAKREDGSFCATLEDGQEVCAGAVLVSTGVQYRRLPLDHLQELEGAGVFYSATEMEARFCSNSEVVIIGGGNSAGQAAMYLSRAASHVHLVVRAGSLAASMSSYLSSRLEADPRITIHYNTKVTRLHGDEWLSGVTLTTDDAPREIETDAMFIMIGAAPNTGWLAGLAETDEKGFVLTGQAVERASPFETGTDGIFAVGDVRSGSVKRVASAVGEGSVVVSQIWSYLDAQRSGAKAR